MVLGVLLFSLQEFQSLGFAHYADAMAAENLGGIIEEELAAAFGA